MYRFLISTLALLAASHGQMIKTDGVGLAIGGFGGGNSLEVIEYGKTCLSSVSFPAIPNAPAGQLEAWSAEYVDDRIWLCGGADINYHSECYSIGIGDEKWKQEGDLNTAREFAASLVFNGELVMMGGFNDRAGWLDKVDKKEAGTGKWIQMDDWKMPRKMYDHCAVQMDRNHIIVIGGNEYGEDFHSSVDILNTDMGVYTSAEPLPVGRASHGCLATHVDGDDGVMVTGGCTDQCQVSKKCGTITLLCSSFKNGKATEQRDFIKMMGKKYEFEIAPIVSHKTLEATENGKVEPVSIGEKHKVRHLIIEVKGTKLNYHNCKVTCSDRHRFVGKHKTWPKIKTLRKI